MSQKAKKIVKVEISIQFDEFCFEILIYEL